MPSKMFTFISLIPHMKALHIFLIASTIYSCSSTKNVVDTPQNSMLWQIKMPGQETTSYLLGTIHLLCKDDLQFSDAVIMAINKAERIYFEMDLDNPDMIKEGLAMLSMKDGKTLKDLYSAEDYEKIAGFFKDSLQIPLAIFNRMKPALLEAVIYPKLLSCETVEGLESAIMEIAKQQKISIYGLEDLTFQSAIFDSIPYQVQAKSFLNIIDSLQEYKNYFNKMYNAYFNNDLLEVEKIMNETSVGNEEEKGLLLTNRNRNWVDTLKNILPKHNVLIAVGAGHLAGDEGLIELFKKEGYQVTAVMNK